MDKELFNFSDYDQTFFSFENKNEQYSSVRITGPDAKRFLNGQLTSDVEALELSSFQQSARLDRTGRVKSFFILIHSDNDSFIALGNKELISILRDDLNKYIIMDDVEITEDKESYLAIISYSRKEGLFSGQLGGLPVYIGKSNEYPDLEELTNEQFNKLQFLRGIPALGLNVSLDQLVTDTILNLNSVSHTKGCYLGQETVSKIQSRRGGAYFPILAQLKEIDHSYEKGIDITAGSEKVGKLLGTISNDSQSFLLISALRKFRVDGMKLSLEGNTANIHYLPLGGEFNQEEWVEALYSEAVDVFHNQGAKEALPLFKDILKILPNHEDTLETIGVIYGQLGEYEKGIGLMDSVLEANPDSIMAHTNKSLFYMKLGKIEEAEEEKAQATVKSFSHFGKEAQQKRIKEELEENERQEIERREGMFKQVLEIDPEDTLANYGMGDIYFKKGLLQEAQESLEQVIRSDSKYSVAYLLLGKTLVQMGNHDSALKTLKEGIEVASTRGDLMPANEMQQMLNKLEK